MPSPRPGQSLPESEPSSKTSGTNSDCTGAITTMDERGPGPLGATCGGCLFSLGTVYRGTDLRLCGRDTPYTTVGTEQRACSEYNPRNGQVTRPLIQKRV